MVKTLPPLFKVNVECWQSKKKIAQAEKIEYKKYRAALKLNEKSN